MVYSASSAYSMEKYSDSGFLLKHHATYLGIGLCVMFVTMRISPRVYKKLVYPAYILGIIILVLVLVPGIGKQVGGATRWIDFGFFSFQPSEFAKFFLILYLAHSLTKKADRMDTFAVGFVSHGVLGGVYIALIILEPDFGLAAIILVLLFSMLFVGGARLRYLATAGLFALLFTAWAILSHDYRVNRILSFLNPWQDPLGAGYQAVQSFTALGLGGLTGTGLGNSTQKLFFLPEAHTDFIFSIIGEELGLIGVVAVITFYGFLLFRGLRVSVRAPDKFMCYLAFGCIILITLQAATNMAVAVGLVPTKGLTLPFISYGGSSLVSSLGAIGVILSISRHTKT